MASKRRSAEKFESPRGEGMLRLRARSTGRFTDCFQYWLPVCTLVVALMAEGCAVRPRPAPVPPAPATLESELLSSLDARRQAVTSLRGLARVVYADPQEQGTARQAIAVETPDQFRLELFSPVGIALLTACDGQTLAAYVPQEKTLYRGAATPMNIARFIRIPLAARDITSLLLGLPVLPTHEEIGSAHADPDTGGYQLTVGSAGHETHTLWFDRQRRLLTRWEAHAPDGALLARVIFADYRKVGGQYFPFEIVMSDTQTKQEASIYYERVELNPPLPDTLFTLRPIPGVQEVDVDAFAGEPSVTRF